MAKLHRLVKSDDRANTHVLTFILPITIGSEAAKDIISTEFGCGYQKWNISLIKQEKESHIGAYLSLKNPSPGAHVTCDFGFTMLNRGHYTSNESFMDSGKVFTKQHPTHGRKSFISTNDIKNPARGFIMDKDQLILEVTLCNFKTYFEYQLQLPMTEKDKAKYPPNDVRLETGFFPFGGMEWNVNLKINERNPQDVRGGSTVTIKRLSNLEHYCKFKYRIHIGVIEPTPLPGTKPTPPKPVMHNPHKSQVISSNEMDSLFIEENTQDKLVLPTNIYKLATLKGVITIKIECYQATLLTLLSIPMDRNRHRALRCYDRDKQAWLLEAHMKSDKLKFYIFYADIGTVPRGCIRMMNIGVSVLPAYGNIKLVKAINSPYTKYYTQRPQDDFGLEIPTAIPMKDIIDTKSIYIYDNTNSLTVQLEWGDSYLLKEIEYSVVDNVTRLHKMQMSKEMQLLQKENLILEKQVHSYQTAIAQKDSKGEYDPMATRPQPPGQAQPGYSDYDRVPVQYDQYGRPINNMAATNQNPMGMTNQMGGMNTMGQMHNNSRDPYGNTTGMQQTNIGGPGVGGPSMGGQDRGLPNHSSAYDTGYSKNDLGMQDPYDQRSHQSRVSGSGGGGGGVYSQDGSLPVPADRNPRSRSADPASHYVSPVPERRPNRRNSTAGAEYADFLEQSPNSRYNRHTSVNDGYRSDSGYRSDTMGKNSDPRGYNDHYNGKDGRPRPSMRSGKPSDSRSDYGDYYSERRPKQSYERDRDIDAYSDRSHKSSGGSRSARSQPIGDSRRNNMLNSNVPTGRASYAGYENEHIPHDNGRPGSSYPNTPRTGSRGGYSRGMEDRRAMENGPR